ncbi:uncharacterized protein LOC141612961 [Silene latifolia]|uniref:uncharacterized protein LOC141612961 n=1 Tax=Silene latifolia TaxID=37657 RepID=UPI003D7819B6
MGMWDGENWIWQLQWRRRMFQWELPLLDSLLVLIEDFRPLKEGEDRHIWSFGKEGVFNLRSFMEAFYNLKYGEVEQKPWFRLVWQGLAPPRYELILWAILWKRVNTKDRVMRWKPMVEDEMNCVFCGVELETVNHLVLHCKFSWRIWCELCDLWGVAWVCPNEVDEAFLAWTGAHFVGFERSLWHACFMAVVAIIWELRNGMVFEGKVPNWSGIRDKVILLVGVWSKAWKENLPYCLEDWVSNWNAIRAWKGKRMMIR